MDANEGQVLATTTSKSVLVSGSHVNRRAATVFTLGVFDHSDTMCSYYNTAIG